ncbi:MAG: hypothetical protein KDD76_00125 [Rickettsiales bacterium]|nr:hypothetical protein [Rickettsiales bacterium]
MPEPKIELPVAKQLAAKKLGDLYRTQLDLSELKKAGVINAAQSFLGGITGTTVGIGEKLDEYYQKIISGENDPIQGVATRQGETAKQYYQRVAEHYLEEAYKTAGATELTPTEILGSIQQIALGMMGDKIPQDKAKELLNKVEALHLTDADRRLIQHYQTIKDQNTQQSAMIITPAQGGGDVFTENELAQIVSVHAMDQGVRLSGNSVADWQKVLRQVLNNNAELPEGVTPEAIINDQRFMLFMQAAQEHGGKLDTAALTDVLQNYTYAPLAQQENNVLSRDAEEVRQQILEEKKKAGNTPIVQQQTVTPSGETQLDNGDVYVEKKAVLNGEEVTVYHFNPGGKGVGGATKDEYWTNANFEKLEDAGLSIADNNGTLQLTQTGDGTNTVAITMDDVKKLTTFPETLAELKRWLGEMNLGFVGELLGIVAMFMGEENLMGAIKGFVGDLKGYIAMAESVGIGEGILNNQYVQMIKNIEIPEDAPAASPAQDKGYIVQSIIGDGGKVTMVVSGQDNKEVARQELPVVATNDNGNWVVRTTDGKPLVLSVAERDRGSGNIIHQRVSIEDGMSLDVLKVVFDKHYTYAGAMPEAVRDNGGAISAADYLKHNGDEIDIAKIAALNTNFIAGPKPSLGKV